MAQENVLYNVMYITQDDDALYKIMCCTRWCMLYKMMYVLQDNALYKLMYYTRWCHTRWCIIQDNALNDIMYIIQDDLLY